MKERQILNAIYDVSIMQYHKTKDKWWLKLAVKVEKKRGEREIKRWWKK